MLSTTISTEEFQKAVLRLRAKNLRKRLLKVLEESKSTKLNRHRYERSLKNQMADWLRDKLAGPSQHFLNQLEQLQYGNKHE